MDLLDGRRHWILHLLLRDRWWVCWTGHGGIGMLWLVLLGGRRKRKGQSGLREWRYLGRRPGHDIVVLLLLRPRQRRVVDVVVVASQIRGPVVNERFSPWVGRAPSSLVGKTAVLVVKEAFLPVLPFKPLWTSRSQDINGRHAVVFLFWVRGRSLSSHRLVSKDLRGRTVSFLLSFSAPARVAAFPNGRLRPCRRIHVVGVVPQQDLWRSFLVHSQRFLLLVLMKAGHGNRGSAAAALLLAHGGALSVFAAGAVGSWPCSTAALSLGALSTPLRASGHGVRWNGHGGIQSLLWTVETIHRLHGWLLHHGGALPYPFCEKD